MNRLQIVKCSELAPTNDHSAQPPKARTEEQEYSTTYLQRLPAHDLQAGTIIDPISEAHGRENLQEL